MIIKLNKSYFTTYRKQIILLLLNIQFISDEFARSIYKKMGFSRYILNSKPQNVLLDAGTSNEHTDICLICNLLGTSHNG